MKTAKRYPFSAILQSRLRLHLVDHSACPDVPTERQFRLWAWQAVKQQYRYADISLVLLDETDARAYNRDYRHKDYATNVLSFEVEPDHLLINTGRPDTLLGDLIVCPQVVLREAAEQGKTPAAHFAHMTVHGILHLMGHDHLEEAEAEVMEALEIRLLNQLGYPNPYQQDAY